MDKLSFVEAPVLWHQEAREEGAPRLGCSIPPPPQHVNQRNMTPPPPFHLPPAQAAWRGL